PYGIIAFELSDKGQADGGQFFGGKKGSYLELGAGPNWPLGGGKATLTIPIKLGVSLKDYYEIPDSALSITDNKFGYFDIGGLITFPLTSVPPKFGSWNIHGGVDVLTFGDTTKAFNINKDGKHKKNA